MKHIQTIQALIKTLLDSDNFHALIVESPPGWGKSTAIDVCLDELGVKAVSIGSYATPLHIYNMVCLHPREILVLDDSAGMFSDVKAMAILKSATWTHNAQSPSKLTARRVSWGSTSEKVEKPYSDFFGKFILLTNSVPSGRETEAFLSRCLSYRIQFTDRDVKKLLLAGARSTRHFPNKAIAQEVARYLVRESNERDLSQVSFRTLRMGYDLALSHPSHWPGLLLDLVPSRTSEIKRLESILRSGLTVGEQEAKFRALTGKSRRSYYNYKKRLGLTRSYRNGE